MDTHFAMQLVQNSLSPELRNKKWRALSEKETNAVAGHCYVAAEALYHLLGGKDQGWVPHYLNHKVWPTGLDPEETHWFIRNTRNGQVLDPPLRNLLAMIFLTISVSPPVF